MEPSTCQRGSHRLQDRCSALGAADESVRTARVEDMRLEDLGLIGNCQFSALVERIRRDRVVLPAALRLGAGLLDAPGSRATAARSRCAASRTARPDRSATSTTRTSWRRPSRPQSGTFRVLDFAPRFISYERMFRPTQLVRVVEPLAGTPRIASVASRKLGWSQGDARRAPRMNHVAFEGFASPLRLTTDVPLAYLGGQPFGLTSAFTSCSPGAPRSRSRWRRSAIASSGRPSATGSTG